MQQGKEQEERIARNTYISINFHIHENDPDFRRLLNVYSGSGYPCIHLIKWAYFISLEDGEVHFCYRIGVVTLFPFIPQNDKLSVRTIKICGLYQRSCAYTL